LGKAKTIPKLNEEKAIETGAQLLSEFIIMSVASAVIVYEYRRSSEKESIKQAEIEREKEIIEDKVMALEMTVAEHRAQLTELRRLAHSIIEEQEKKSRWRKSNFFGGSDEEDKSKPKDVATHFAVGEDSPLLRAARDIVQSTSSSVSVEEERPLSQNAYSGATMLETTQSLLDSFEGLSSSS